MEITHRFFLKLWPQMRLGATVTTRKQNKHQANGERLILQNQRRPERFDQMLRSCWLVFFMLIELCTSNLFLLDKLWINNFIWRCSKITQQCTEKTTRNVEQRWLAPSPRQCPCTHGLQCAAVFGIKHDGYASSSLFTRTCVMRLFPVPSYEMPDERDVSEVKKKTLEVLNNISSEEFQKCFADVSKVKKKTLEVLNNIRSEEFQKCFQQWEKCWYKYIESKGEYFEGD